MAGSVTTMQLLLSAVLLCGMTVAAASTPIHPTTPTAYTAVSNTTIVQNGQTLNLQQTVLYANNMSLTVAPYKGNTQPFQLQTAYPDCNQGQYGVKPTATCSMSVVHNQVCPGGSPAKCTNNNNFFFLLQYTMYSGDCGDGASHEMWQGQFDNIKPGISLVVQYCFDGSDPVFLEIDWVTSTTKEATHSPATQHAVDLSDAVAHMVGGTPTVPTSLNMQFEDFDSEPPNPSAFNVPAFCTCSSA